MTTSPIDIAGAPRENEVPNIQVLNQYLQTQKQVGEVVEITQFPSGYSNLTFCLKTKTAEYILRRPPIGANIKSAHDMGREFTVLSQLKPHYSKVPTPIAYCENAEIIGAPFYIMERLRGTILRATNAPKLLIAPEVYRTLSESLVNNLVDLHSIDIHKTGLIQLGKPEGYVQRQVEGWIKRYRNAETDSLEHMNSLAEWLPYNMPAEHPPAFLHNDYKYDNVVLDPNDMTKIIGVLDWEMATVGDPLMDLGACLAYWAEAEDDPVLQSFNLTSLPGNISRKEFAAQYSAKSNRNISNILFYYAFGLFKNAVIAQQIYARWKNGFTKDPRFGGLIMVIKSLASQGVKTLEKQKL